MILSRRIPVIACTLKITESKLQIMLRCKHGAALLPIGYLWQDTFFDKLGFL